jgi:hypothetical protein
VIVTGVRPSDITVGAGCQPEAKMLLSENTGAQTLLYLNVGGVDVGAVVSGRPVIPKREALRFTIDPAKIACDQCPERQALVASDGVPCDPQRGRDGLRHRHARRR